MATLTTTPFWDDESSFPLPSAAQKNPALLSPFDTCQYRQESSRSNGLIICPTALLTRRSLRELDRFIGAERFFPTPPTSLEVELAFLVLPQSSRELLRFARRGGPDLRNLRGFPSPKILARMAKINQVPSGNSGDGPQNRIQSSIPSTKRSSAYNIAFEGVLACYNIFIDGYKLDGRPPPKPKNLAEIRESLKQRRSSLSSSHFDDAAFDAFQMSKSIAYEAEFAEVVMPLIWGKSDIPQSGGAKFSNLKTLTGPDVVVPMPDTFDGVLLDSVAQKVRDDLNEIIIPSKRRNVPLVPNFSIEVKPDTGSMEVGHRQACHNGAYGARAMLWLQNYGKPGEPIVDENAYAYSAVYVGGTLVLYAHFVHKRPLTKKSAGVEDLEYHMTQLGGFFLQNDLETCVKGMTALRNLRDRAMSERVPFVEAANEIARAMTVPAAEANTTSAELKVPETRRSPHSKSMVRTTSSRTTFNAISAKRPASQESGTEVEGSGSSEIKKRKLD